MARFIFGPGGRRASAARECHDAAADKSTLSACQAGPGPGWYDSSWELKCGLDVHEGPPADATLHEWLVHLQRR